jgi:hypothetical protein
MTKQTRRMAAMAMAAALTQLAACSTTAPKVSASGSGACMTNRPLLASQVPADDSSNGGMLVDAAGPLWNCASIPQGLYDAEVMAQWSRGYHQQPLQLTNFRLAPGQMLVARAYERGRGEIRTVFHSVAPSREPEKAVLAVPVQAEPQPAPKAEEPVMTAADLAQGTAMVAGGAALAVLFLPYAGVIAIESIKANKDARRAMVSQERSRPDCCYLWVEDRQTGQLIAGSRPPL